MTKPLTLERLAKIVNGPYRPVEASSGFTLDQLRDVRWDMASAQEQAFATQVARTLIRELNLDVA